MWQNISAKNSLLDIQLYKLFLCNDVVIFNKACICMSYYTALNLLTLPFLKQRPWNTTEKTLLNVSNARWSSFYSQHIKTFFQLNICIFNKVIFSGWKTVTISLFLQKIWAAVIYCFKWGFGMTFFPFKNTLNVQVEKWKKMTPLINNIFFRNS